MTGLVCECFSNFQLSQYVGEGSKVFFAGILLQWGADFSPFVLTSDFFLPSQIFFVTFLTENLQRFWKRKNFGFFF